MCVSLSCELLLKHAMGVWSQHVAMPVRVVEALRESCSAFFSLPLEDKLKSNVHDHYGSGGFTPQGVEAVGRSAAADDGEAAEAPPDLVVCGRPPGGVLIVVCVSRGSIGAGVSLVDAGKLELFAWSRARRHITVAPSLFGASGSRVLAPCGGPAGRADAAISCCPPPATLLL